MNNPLHTPEYYELFLYTLAEKFPSAHRSTVTFVRRGATLARVTGELFFDMKFRLVVCERIFCQRIPASIDWYGYEIWKGEEKLFWYDSQPHPNDPGLQSTHPHHKQVPPDIKHHRIPSPNMSFSRPNIPELIREIKALISV